MNTNGHFQGEEQLSECTTSSLLILDDGRVLARNVTPALANLLQALFPADETLALRVTLPGHAPTSLETSPFPTQKP